MLKRFKYLKTGEKVVSDRVVFQLHGAGNMLALDLSEFNEGDQEFLDKELMELVENFEQGIKDLALDFNYRQFKKECMSNG